MTLASERVVQIGERKKTMRRQIYSARAEQEKKDEISAIICEKFIALPEYQVAKTVMWYIDCRSETRTKRYLQKELEKADKTIVVPYCTTDKEGQNKLGLWKLTGFDELVAGTWDILEPPRELWGNPEREVEAGDLDLVMVPGVGFDSSGGRMGNGQGYYDRLLARVRADCPLIAVCYEAQISDRIPVAPHDVFMDKIITEQNIYTGKERC